jgi:hypothetical protein
MDQPEGNKPPRILLLFLASLGFAIYGFIAIWTGQVRVGGRSSGHYLLAAQHPREFWCMVAVYFAMAGLFLLMGFNIKK